MAFGFVLSLLLHLTRLIDGANLDVDLRNLLFVGEVVGGIGVSSGTPAQDREVAEAGIAAFLAARG